jgi:hypothetical protein
VFPTLYITFHSICFLLYINRVLLLKRDLFSVFKERERKREKVNLPYIFLKERRQEREREREKERRRRRRQAGQIY